ncbi:MAG: DUF1223 domain-containing protein [Rhodospirillales bacterium]
MLRLIRHPAFFSGLLLFCALKCGPIRATEPVQLPKHSPLTVVELFTSQGCSSCPPADDLIGELAGRTDILALAEHVDYWDYLGWKDPYASPAHSARQREYARALGIKYVYTPQIVVQGRTQVAGNERNDVLGAIVAQQRTTSPSLLSVNRTGPQGLSVCVEGGSDRSADVWLVLYDRTRSTHIDRGENSGRALVNYNVVRSFRRIARWEGQPLQATASLDNEDWASRGCAVILQSENAGPILDAVPCLPPTG